MRRPCVGIYSLLISVHHTLPGRLIYKYLKTIKSFNRKIAKHGAETWLHFKLIYDE